MAGNSSGDVIVKIDHVEKIYQSRSGEVVALNGVDMEIRENEFVCVVGPSGCGKSTLLNIIAGLERPTSGRVCRVKHMSGETGRVTLDDGTTREWFEETK